MTGILDELGLLEGTDKNSLTHGYLRHYERVVGPHRDEPITLLEIGVERGGSLRTWARYFTRATIVGVDIKPDCAKHAGDRRIVEIGSQADAAFLTELGVKYQPTVIIDDGSHLADHILLTFQTLWPYLQHGGTYIVEDIHFHVGASASELRGGASVSPVEYFQKLAGYAVSSNASIEKVVHFIDTIEFWHGGVAIRKRPAPEADPFAEKRRLVERANLPDIWGAFAMFVLQHHGDPAEAAAAARRACALAPSEAVHSYQLSCALEQSGDVRGAIDAARVAVALDPGFTMFRERLARLEA